MYTPDATMQYMSKAFTVRIDEGVLQAAQASAKDQGISFTAYVLGAIEDRLKPRGRPMIGAPMSDETFTIIQELAPQLLDEPFIDAAVLSGTNVPRESIHKPSEVRPVLRTLPAPPPRRHHPACKCPLCRPPKETT